jgi:hypothetical protein
METKKYKATFTEGMLATKPNDADVFETYIATKREEGIAQDEVDTAKQTEAEVERIEKGKTVFHRNENGQPVIWDYMLKGYLKECIKALRRNPKSAWKTDKGLNAYKGIIDCNVFVKPRQIVLNIPEGKEITECSRPLRAQTPQGERVALAKSEEVPAGTTMEFEVITTMPGLEKGLKECWDYAVLHGMGAWRNSGKGTCVIEEIK